MKKIIVSLIIVVITFIFSTGIAYAVEFSETFSQEDIDTLNEQLLEDNPNKEICDMIFFAEGDILGYTFRYHTDQTDLLADSIDEEILNDTFQELLTAFNQEGFSYFPEVYDTTFILRITDANDTIIKEVKETVVNPYYDESAEAAYYEEYTATYQSPEEAFQDRTQNIIIAALLILAPALFYRLLRGCAMTSKGAGLFALITTIIVAVILLLKSSFQNIPYIGFLIFAVISYGILRFGAAKQKESSRNVEQD